MCVCVYAIWRAVQHFQQQTIIKQCIMRQYNMLGCSAWQMTLRGPKHHCALPQKSVLYARSAFNAAWSAQQFHIVE